MKFLIATAMIYYCVAHYVDFRVGFDMLRYDISRMGGSHETARRSPDGELRPGALY